MGTVRVYNTSTVEQMLPGGPWIAPRSHVDVPLEKAERFRRTRIVGLLFDFEGSGDGLKCRDEAGQIKHLHYLSPMSPYNGYGVCGIQFILGCVKRDVRLSFPLLPNDEQMEALAKEYPQVHTALLQPIEPCRAGICHAIPPEFHKLACEVVVGHTMYESTRIPWRWVEPCNKMDALILPSQVQVEMFGNCGVTTPMHVVGDPIDTNFFAYRRPTKKDRPFTFFCWARLSERKMPIELVQCFRAAFGDRTDVRLVMKTHSFDFGKEMHGLKPVTQWHNNVTVVNEYWSPQQVLDQLYDSDCAVWLSHGEGQYNPPLQAMAAGIPVIVPNHSGMADYATDDVCWPITQHTLSPSKLEGDGEWWNPNLDETVDKLRYIVTAPKREVDKKVRAARKLVETKYTVDAHTDGVLKVVDQVAG